MTFKTKIKNKIFTDERQTLDAKHNTILQYFQENKNNLPKLRKQIDEINEKLIILNKQNENNNNIIDLELQREISNLDDKKKELEKEI